MSKRKLTEVEKAYIEKFYTKSPELLAKDLGAGIGPKTIEKYVEEYVESQKSQASMVQDGNTAPIKTQELAFDPTELAGKHDRGGVLTMTQGLSEYLDEVSKKSQVHDYRGKMAKIRKDKPTPKNIKIDE